MWEQHLLNVQVRDISGSFRWAPFLALQTSNSFLTMLLLLSKYKMKSIPVVDLGEGKIENIITQSAVIHMLAECAGLQWFERWGTKTLSELGLPMMSPASIVKVHFLDSHFSLHNHFRELIPCNPIIYYFGNLFVVYLFSMSCSSVIAGVRGRACSTSIQTYEEEEGWRYTCY